LDKKQIVLYKTAGEIPAVDLSDFGVVKKRNGITPQTYLSTFYGLQDRG